MLRDCGEVDDMVFDMWYGDRCVGGCGGGDRLRKCLENWV